MQIKSRLNQWGDVEVELISESSHEETLLKLIGQQKAFVSMQLGELGSAVVAQSYLQLLFGQHEASSPNATSASTSRTTM